MALIDKLYEEHKNQRGVADALVDMLADIEKVKVAAPTDKGKDPIYVRAYVSFHRPHYRRRWFRNGRGRS